MALQRFTAFLRNILSGPAPISDREALVGFLAGEASFIAQKCTIEYCRARAGVIWDKLFKEPAFHDALEHCRWESFALVLEDVCVVADSRLRGADGPGRPDIADAMGDIAWEALNRFGVPGHRVGVGWWDSAEAIRGRLARAQLAPPLPAHEVARVSGKAVWGLLPMHPDIRAYDRELVANNIRFNMCRCATEMDRRFAPHLSTLVVPPASAAA